MSHAYIGHQKKDQRQLSLVTGISDEKRLRPLFDEQIAISLVEAVVA
jgi:hypothetical protein